MAHVIDRVDLLAYLASGAGLRDPSTGTPVVRLSEADAYSLRETLPAGSGQPLAPHVLGSAQAADACLWRSIRERFEGGAQARQIVGRKFRRCLECAWRGDRCLDAEAHRILLNSRLPGVAGRAAFR